LLATSINPLNANMNLNYVQICSPDRAVNTLRLSYKNQSLMFYTEKIAVCSEIHTKRINTLCGQTVEFMDVKLAVYKEPVRTAQ
jgi:hypothetical protein